MTVHADQLILRLLVSHFKACGHHGNPHHVADPGFRHRCHDCLVATVASLASSVAELQAASEVDTSDGSTS